MGPVCAVRLVVELASTEPAPEIKAAEKFILFEWAVLKTYRGQGIGEAVLTRLLAGRPETWLTLCAHPEGDAYQIYRRAGWEPVAPVRREGWPAMVAMVLGR